MINTKLIFFYIDSSLSINDYAFFVYILLSIKSYISRYIEYIYKVLKKNSIKIIIN